MTNNTQTKEDPLQGINDFLKLIGFDEQKIEEHHQRLNKLIFMAIADDLETLSAMKEKSPFPEELKTAEDFFAYYEQYLDRELIAKIVKEKYHKFYSEYIGAMDKSLEGLDSI